MRWWEVYYVLLYSTQIHRIILLILIKPLLFIVLKLVFIENSNQINEGALKHINNS